MRKTKVENVLNQRVLIREDTVPARAESGKLVKIEEKTPIGTGVVEYAAKDLKQPDLLGKTVIFDRRQALPLKLDDGSQFQGDLLMVHESMLYVVLTKED